MEKNMKLEDRFMLMMCDFVIDFYDDKTGECVQTAEAYNIMDGIIARKVERDKAETAKLNYLNAIGGYDEFKL